MAIIITALAVWLVGSIPMSIGVGWWLRRCDAAGTAAVGGPASAGSGLLGALRADSPRTDAA